MIIDPEQIIRERIKLSFSNAIERLTPNSWIVLPLIAEFPGNFKIFQPVELPGGISPPGPHRTGRDSLPSSGSYHPVAFYNNFTLLPGSSNYWLTKRQGQMIQPLRSIPITGTSTLLRVGPPLCPASVLSFLWGPPLEFLP